MSSDRLITPRFLVMCTFTFTVFVSLFQLLPTAPYHIVDLGGSTTAAGLFLGMLTFASAAAAPFTGHIGDRIGHRRVLVGVSLVLAAFVAAYGVIASYRWMLALVVVHGAVWSALLTASGAYMTATIPPARRAEGLGYWGLASILAIGIAPPLGFWVYRFGWGALCAEMVTLNLVMAFVAWRLPDERAVEPEAPAGDILAGRAGSRPGVIERPALLLSVTVAFMAFAYGGMTSFSSMFADSLRASPRSIFLTAMAAAIITVRLLVGRQLDRFGHRRVLLPSLAVGAAGLLLLAAARGTWGIAAAALVFGAGFGLTFPSYAAYLMSHVPAFRRGAAYGALIAAFDTGIGTGSTTMGWLIGRIGFRGAFVAAAAIALLAIPYFLVAERRLGFARLSSP